MKREKFYSYCDKVIRFSFYSLIYFLPISIALIEVFATLALLTFFFKRTVRFYGALKEKTAPHGIFQIFLDSFKPVPSPIAVPIGYFILANFISVILSEYVFVSLGGFFFKLLQSTFIVFTFMEGMRTRGQLRIFITVFMISAGVVTGSGIFQYLTTKDFIHGHPLMDGRVTSSFKHPNDFGTYLAVVLPIIVSLVFYWIKLFIGWLGKSKKRLGTQRDICILVLLIAVFVSSLACLGLTLSRGAWAAALTALLFLGLQSRKILPAFILIIVFFSLVFLPRLEKVRNVSFMSDNVKIQRRDLARMVDKEESSFLNYSKSYLKTIEHFEGMGRGGFWREAWSIIRIHPIFGNGPNTYSKIMSDMRSNAGGYPHNCFLQMWAEIGIVGLIAFLGIVFVFYWNFFRTAFACADPFLRDVSFGFMAALTGYLLHSFIDTNLYSAQLGNLFWVLLAAASVLPRAENPR